MSKKKEITLPPMRTMKQVAKYINTNTRALGGLTAETMAWTSSTDSKIAGTRLRRVGRGRKGTRIQIYAIAAGLMGGRALVFDQKPETYRRVHEVTDWLTSWANGSRLDQYRRTESSWRAP